MDMEHGVDDPSAAAVARLRAALAVREEGTEGEWGIGNDVHIATGVEQVSRGGFTYRYEIADLDDDRDAMSGLPWRDGDPNNDRDNPATAEDDAQLIVTAVNLLEPMATALIAVLEQLGPNAADHEHLGVRELRQLLAPVLELT